MDFCKSFEFMIFHCRTKHFSFLIFHHPNVNEKGSPHRIDNEKGWIIVQIRGTRLADGICQSPHLWLDASGLYGSNHVQIAIVIFGEVLFQMCYMHCLYIFTPDNSCLYADTHLQIVFKKYLKCVLGFWFQKYRRNSTADSVPKSLATGVKLIYHLLF